MYVCVCVCNLSTLHSQTVCVENALQLFQLKKKEKHMFIIIIIR